MARRGRGDYPGFPRSRAPLPASFKIDEDLQEAAEETQAEDRGEDDIRSFFPEIDFIMAAPITEEEREDVRWQRDFNAKRRAGPFWTGSKEQWAEVDGKSGANSNPFEDAPTYGNKRKKKPFQLANFKKVKCIYPQFLPKELLSMVTDEPGPDGEQPKKKLGLSKAVDKLAKYDKEEDEDDTNVEGEEDLDEDAEEGEEEKEESEDEFERDPGNDDFDGDEEDDNDYNAEKYFDDGEGENEDEDEFGGAEEGLGEQCNGACRPELLTKIVHMPSCFQYRDPEAEADDSPSEEEE